MLLGNGFSKKRCNYFACDVSHSQEREMAVACCRWNMYLLGTPLNHNCSICMCWSPRSGEGQIWIKMKKSFERRKCNSKWKWVLTQCKQLGFFIFADKVGGDWTRLKEDLVMFHKLTEVSRKCKCSRATALDQFLLFRKAWSRIPS